MFGKIKELILVDIYVYFIILRGASIPTNKFGHLSYQSFNTLLTPCQQGHCVSTTIVLWILAMFGYFSVPKHKHSSRLYCGLTLWFKPSPENTSQLY